MMMMEMMKMVLKVIAAGYAESVGCHFIAADTPAPAEAATGEYWFGLVATKACS